MLITSGTLPSDALRDKVAVVTGAGRGIGFEAARCMARLGAKVVVAELDPVTGRAAAAGISRESGEGRSLFVRTDVAEERSIERLRAEAHDAYGRVDIVVNNATITPMGAVKDRAIADWDASYRVNLRGPVMIARTFLPEMIARDWGVFVCVSSVGHAYMGAYECFKVAQVHLAETIDAELEGTGVVAITVSPGLVRTPGAEAGIAELAPMYGKTVDEFYNMSKGQLITVEEAGAGFAAAVALASRFRGQEIGSRQALIAAGIRIGSESEAGSQRPLSPSQRAEALSLSETVGATLAEQSEGWKKRSLFERQWVIRDFRKNAGMPVDQWLEALDRLTEALRLERHEGALAPPPLQQLAAYYSHLAQLAEGYEKDPAKREEQHTIIGRWEGDVRSLAALLQNSQPT